MSARNRRAYPRTMIAIAWGTSGVGGALLIALVALFAFGCAYISRPHYPSGATDYGRSALLVGIALFLLGGSAIRMVGAVREGTVEFTFADRSAHFDDGDTTYDVVDTAGTRYDVTHAIYTQLGRYGERASVSCRATDPPLFLDRSLVSCRLLVRPRRATRSGEARVRAAR